MNLDAIYTTLCLSDDPAAALRKMQDATLSALATHLAGSGITTGIPGLVLAMAEAEAARRWLADNQDRPGAVGEGSL